MGNQQFEDQLIRFGGGAASSTITPQTLALVVAAIVLLFLLPRKYIIVLFLIVSMLIPLAQVVVIGGLHFMVFRIMLPFVWVRVIAGKLSGRSSESFQFGAIDKAIVVWALTGMVCFTLLWWSWGAFVNRLGFLYNVFGVYFLLRFLIKDREDLNRTIRTLAILWALIAVFMVREQLTGRNIFSVFGGVREFTQIRDGRVRSQAAFAHAILAGTVGATLLPLFVGLWWQRSKAKLIAALGILSALIMMLTSSSATPLSACFAGIAGLSMWPFRRRMRLFRWGAVVGLVSLHLLMKAPVWALIERINLVGGNSGYHRFELVNQAIVHFGDWWLVGTRDPSSWGSGMTDTSNAYVETAVTGGLLPLILFLGVLWQAFRALGIARKAAEGDRQLERLLWAFGATLFATAVAFIGVSYFDQSFLIWYALLAMTCTVTSIAPVPVPIPGSENVRAGGPLRPLVGRRLAPPAAQEALGKVMRRGSPAFIPGRQDG